MIIFSRVVLAQRQFDQGKEVGRLREKECCGSEIGERVCERRYGNAGGRDGDT